MIDLVEYLEHHVMIDLVEREVARTALSSLWLASEQLVKETGCTNSMCAQAGGDSLCAPDPSQPLEESVRELSAHVHCSEASEAFGRWVIESTSSAGGWHVDRAVGKLQLLRFFFVPMLLLDTSIIFLGWLAFTLAHTLGRHD